MGFHHKGRVILAVSYGLSTGGALYVALNEDGEHDYGTIRHGDPAKCIVQLKVGDTITGKFGTAVVTSVKVFSERPEVWPESERWPGSKSRGA